MIMKYVEGNGHALFQAISQCLSAGTRNTLVKTAILKPKLP